MTFSVRVAKRTIDLLFSAIALLLTLPFYPFIALLIRFESKGDIFYMQDRVQGYEDTPEGSHIVTFRMVKFRTMIQNAEQQTGAVVAQKGDKRITKIGAFLRRTRLDELPQFWNVLLGDMSVVGPRPERPELLKNLKVAVPFFDERMRGVKPGITGLAQVNLGYTGEMDKTSPLYKMKDILTNPFEIEGIDGSLADDMRIKMLFDLSYIASLERLSTFVVMDLKIMVMTPWIMFFKKKGR